MRLVYFLAPEPVLLRGKDFEFPRFVERDVVKNTLPMIIFVLRWAYVLITAIAIQAQQTDRNIVTINTDLVTTWTQVTNPKDGSLIKRLVVDDFQLREAGKAQHISLITEGQPLSVVLLVEGYAHIWPAERWYRHIEETLHELGEDTEIAVMLYDSTTVMLQPLTKNMSVLRDKLKDKAAFHYFLGRHLPERIAEALPGEIALPRIGGAIYEATKYLDKAAAPERRKIIIFVTTPSFWQNEVHFRTRAEVENLLEQTGTTVYALLHGNGVRVHEGDPLYAILRRNAIKKRDKGGTLEHFVGYTGGIALKGAWEECDNLFTNLAKQIRSSYTIGYYPENTNFDGKFRRIKLELSKSGKAKFGNVDIKTREGYYAVRPALADVSEKSK